MTHFSLIFFEPKRSTFFQLSIDALDQLFYEKLIKSVIHFFDQQPNIIWLKVFNIWFNFSINFFKSNSIFYFYFFDQLPFFFLIIVLPSYDTLFTTKITNKKHTFLSSFLNQKSLHFSFHFCTTFQHCFLTKNLCLFFNFNSNFYNLFSRRFYR